MQIIIIGCRRITRFPPLMKNPGSCLPEYPTTSIPSWNAIKVNCLRISEFCYYTRVSTVLQVKHLQILIADSMVNRYRNYSGRLIERWVGLVDRHPLMVIIFAIATTSVVLVYSITNFKINVDTTTMISDKLQFRRLQNDFQRAFPGLSNTIVIVLDAENAEPAIAARKQFAERLRREKRLFESVYEPGGEQFFEKRVFST